MKKSNTAKRKTTRRKPLEDPKVITYERDELAAEKPAVICQTSAPSDRNLKKSFKPVNSKKIAKKLASFEKPEVVTYERDELVARTAFTQVPSQVISDRNLKRNCKPVNVKKIAGKLASFEKPEVVTYERDELAAERSFVACQSSNPASDRNLKKNFRSVNSKQIAKKLASFEKPEIITYDRDELVEKTIFTGTQPTSGTTGSDRNLKRNFRSVRARNILARLD